MFKWFNKDKNVENKKLDNVESIVEHIKVKIANNYEVKDNGDIEIRFRHYTRNGCGWVEYNHLVPKSSIISHTENNIVLKDDEYFYNYEASWYISNDSYPDFEKVIEYKDNLIKYKESQIQTLEYYKDIGIWEITDVDIVKKEIISERTPLEVFIEESNSKYKLIETVDEFNEYLSSTLDCDTWCRKKLYNKMKELGLGDGFINQFADLVGNNLDKYHAMIDLAKEVSDKDTLMYLYTYKFSQ